VGRSAGAETGTQGLLCYKAKHRVRFGDREPFVADQFLQSRVQIIRRMEFCVPSSIGGILPTTTTTTGVPPTTGAPTTSAPTTTVPTTTTSTTIQGSPSSAFLID